MTLEESKAWLHERLNDGAICPCCTQYVKLYRRRLYSTLARMLILFYKLDAPNEWIHVREAMRITGSADFRGDWAKLKYWGLIEEKPNDKKKDTKTSGFWKITNKGACFVQKSIKVKSHILLFNSKFYGFSGKDVTIDECLGKNFSYSELMSRF